MEIFKYKRYHIPNVVKTISVLRELSRSPKGLTRAEIVKATGFTESIIFRILYTMLDYEMIVKSSDESHYRISKQFVSIAYDSIDDDNLILSSRDIMKSIRDEFIETVMLGILSENEVLMIDQIVGKNYFSFTGRVGLRCPLHSSAPAKSILAFLPEGEREATIKKMDFPKFTKNTISSRKDYRRELDKVRELGFAVDNQEFLNGTNCVGVPVFDYHSYPVASIWITGPSDRIPSSEFEKIGARMIESAKDISRRLGYNK